MPKQKKKFIPLPYKQLGKDISKYPFVEIRWVDIEGDDGWSTLSSLDKDKLPLDTATGSLSLSNDDNVLQPSSPSMSTHLISTNGYLEISFPSCL